MYGRPTAAVLENATLKDGSSEYIVGITRKTARTWDTLLQDEGDRKFFCVVGEAHALSVWSCHTSDIETNKVTVEVTMTFDGEHVSR